MREDKKSSVQGSARQRQEALREELLSEAFQACMEEQLSFIPPEREIARTHTFSEEFKAAMEELCRTKGKYQKRELTRREFVFGFNKIAACIVMMLAVGGVCVGGYLISQKGAGSGASEMAMDTAAPEEALEEESAGSGMDRTENTEAEEDAAAAGASDDAGTGLPAQAEFMGGQIPLAGTQVLPSESDGIRMLISSPVIDREAESLKVTFGNLTEETVSYSRGLELQVYLAGAWYVVPKTMDVQAPEDDLVALEPGMAQDEELVFSSYELDYEAEKYRVVGSIDETPFGSEFRFETLEEGLEEALENALEGQDE